MYTKTTLTCSSLRPQTGVWFFSVSSSFRGPGRGRSGTRTGATSFGDFPHDTNAVHNAVPGGANVCHYMVYPYMQAYMNVSEGNGARLSHVESLLHNKTRWTQAKVALIRDVSDVVPSSESSCSKFQTTRLLASFPIVRRADGPVDAGSRITQSMPIF
jgi:hypothetical protein